MILFSIVTAGRTGSTFLCQALDVHPKIKCEEEVFNRSRYDSGSFNFYLNQAFHRRLLSRLFNRDRMLGTNWNLPMTVLSRSFIRSKQKKYPCYGFKITQDQLEAYPSIAEFLQENAKVILLCRQDQLRATFSLMKARSTGNYDLFDDTSRSFDVKSVIQQLMLLKQWQTRQAATFSTALHLYSEALFLYPKKHLEQVVQFLGIDPGSMGNLPKPVPLNPTETSDWVENYDAIKEAVREIDE